MTPRERLADALLGVVVWSYKAANRYGPSIKSEGRWAALPAGRMVGGVVMSTHRQIVGGRRWSITLHTDMEAARAKFTVRTPEGEQTVARVEVQTGGS